MGRKRRSRRGERDVSNFHPITSFAARPRGPLLGFTPLASVGSHLPDGRNFHPLGQFRPAATIRGGIATVGLADRQPKRTRSGRIGRLLLPGFSQTKAVRAFDAPKAVSVCIRRNQRKEVLHALRRAGKRGSQRKRRRTQWSHVSCR